jgi:hypothetical protein
LEQKAEEQRLKAEKEAAKAAAAAAKAARDVAKADKERVETEQARFSTAERLNTFNQVLPLRGPSHIVVANQRAARARGWDRLNDRGGRGVTSVLWPKGMP